MADIPVYLVAGFLDAGKTNFINGILEDGFARQDPTLLLCCEEGEEEYEKNALDNVTVITIEDEEDPGRPSRLHRPAVCHRRRAAGGQALPALRSVNSFLERL